MNKICFRINIMKKGFLLIFLLFYSLFSQIQWGPDIRLTPLGDTTRNWEPRAAVWGDTIHLVWAWEGRINSIWSYDIFYMRSTDRGETWESPKNLTINDPDDASMPWITVWGNKVHVVYQEGYGDSIMYIRSLDGGETWGNPIKLMKPASGAKIANISDTLFVITGNMQNPFLMIRSFDGGNTWTSPSLIDTTSSARRIEINSPYLQITGYYPGYEVSYFRSPDKGNTWEGPFVISPVDSWSSNLPVLAVSDSNVYISWMEGMFCPFPAWFNVNIRKSPDNGNFFLPRESLTSVCAGYYSDIYAKDSIVVLVWMDERDNPGQSDFELYWRASYDYGNTWTTENRLTYAPGDSRWPALTGWDNEIYLFWVDTRTDSVEIFFKKGIYTDIEESYSTVDKKDVKFLSSNVLFLPDRIRFFVKEGQKYYLNLFDLDGRKILTLKEGVGRGKEEIILDKVNSGSYFLILETQTKTLKRKITILKGGKKP